MVVITLTDCPIGLRGDLTKWLLEIQPGVFVGNINSRVREKLWERIKSSCKNARVVMVYNTNGEQKLGFKVFGGAWEPIDFDGIKLILRPSPSRLKKSESLKPGFSKFAKIRTAKRMTSAKSRFPTDYIVVDVETTGLDADKDSIIEIAAIKIEGNAIIEKFSTLIRSNIPIPQKIIELTGITESMLLDNGVELSPALSKFLEFVGPLPVVSHNADFDLGFLRNACSRCGLPLFSNRCIDTLSLSKRVVSGVKNYKLSTLAEHFGISQQRQHRGEDDCIATKQLYEKLIDMLESS
jgi:CRISPR-associated protein Cas2